MKKCGKICNLNSKYLLAYLNKESQFFLFGNFLALEHSCFGVWLFATAYLIISSASGSASATGSIPLINGSHFDGAGRALKGYNTIEMNKKGGK